MHNKHLNKVTVAAILAVIISVCSYCLDNLPFAAGSQNSLFFFLENTICRWLGDKDDCDDVFFINTAFEQTTANITDQFGFQRGSVAITNREALDSLLTRLQRADTYSQIFLDVRFEKEIKTQHDSSLFHRIASMRDITIATHRDIELADTLLASKAAMSDYSYTADNSGFSRYQFIQNGKESAALKMYRDSTGRTIRKLGFLPAYHDGARLCKNALFIKIHKDMSVKQSGLNPVNYYDMGFELNRHISDQRLSSLIDGKFVFIGDFLNDTHGTYYGEQPGAYLTYLSLKSLLEKRHVTSIFFLVAMLLTYFLMSLWVLADYPLLSYFNIDNRLIRFILSLIGYSAILMAISTLIFAFTKSTYSILIPSFVFSIISLVKSYSKS